MDSRECSRLNLITATLQALIFYAFFCLPVFFAFVLLIAFVLWHSATVIIVAVVILKPDYALRQRLTKSILVSRFYDIFLVPFSICKTKEIYIKTHSTVRFLLLWGFFVTP